MAVIKADNYEMSNYWDCPRKFYYRFEKQLAMKGEPGGKEFGLAFHKGREAWKRAVMRGEAEAVAYAVGAAAFASEWKAHFSAVPQVDERRSLVNGHALFRGYVQKFRPQAYKPITVEVPFEVPLGQSPAGNEVYLRGILDEFCEFDGRLYVLDAKTTSFFPDARWFEAWKTSNQMKGYMWAAEEWRQEKIAGVIIHAVYVNTPPKTTKGKYKFEDYFRADIVNFTDEKLEEWRMNFLHTVDEREEARRKGFWRMQGGSMCKAFNTLCEYHSLCSANQAEAELLEGVYYDKVTWDPMAEERLQVAA